jgi:hypothetical protein
MNDWQQLSNLRKPQRKNLQLHSKLLQLQCKNVKLHYKAYAKLLRIPGRGSDGAFSDIASLSFWASVGCHCRRLRRKVCNYCSFGAAAS